MTEDKFIWEAFKNNEDDALSYIYHQNVDFLFFYGKKFTIDEDLILDVIQDLFFHLIRKRKTLGKTDNVRLYLLKSFRRELFKELKKSNRQVELDENSQPLPEIIFSIEENLINDEIQSEKEEVLKEGMQQLNKRQREVLYYKFTCGYDYNQICDIMSISYDTARQMVSRAVQLLKKYVSGKGFILWVLFSTKSKKRHHCK